MDSECNKKDMTECVKKKAYELWEKEGRKQGRDLYYWQKAEKTVAARIKK